MLTAVGSFLIRRGLLSLLQSPHRALDQIEWYLDNAQHELFPGAFHIAAGNLARQVLEQVLFILAFYGGLPREKWMRPDKRLRPAGRILHALEQPSSSGADYFVNAAKRGSRIRKFARLRPRLPSWLQQLNEPSHYHNAAARRRTGEKAIRRFSQALRSTFEDLDAYLLTAAVNEMISDGKVRAFFGSEPECIPAAEVTMVVQIRDVIVENGRPSLHAPRFPIRIIPSDQEVGLRRSKAVILVQHSAGMALQGRFVNSQGDPIDLSSFEASLRSLAPTKELQVQLARRLRRLGFASLHRV